MQYVPSDPRTFFSTDVPWWSADATIRRPITVTDYFGNIWQDQCSFPIVEPEYIPRRDTLYHVKGPAAGSFEIVAVDPSQFKGHTYVVCGVDSINSAGDAGVTLIDSTDGRVLLREHPLPDPMGHTVPVMDGFRLLQGNTVSTSGRMVGYELPEGDVSW